MSFENVFYWNSEYQNMKGSSLLPSVYEYFSSTANFKAIFVGRKKMKATLLVTDATDDLDLEGETTDLVGTNMVMTITFESPGNVIVPK